MAAPPPSTSPDLNVLPLSINETLGACFAGFAVSCCIYGIFLTQVATYFSRYPSDRALIKFLVVTILILETADQGFIAHLTYYYGIYNFAKPEVLIAGTVTWSFILQMAVGSAVGAIVKASFSIRVWRFSGRNIWITGLVMLMVLGGLGLATTYTIKAFQLPNVFAVANLRMLGTISLAVGMATDFITAGALCFFLNQLRTGYKQSDSLVDCLVRYAINTGVLTSAVSLTVLLLYNFMPRDNLWFVGVYFTLSKLYAISYLATLNTRRMVKGRGTDQEGVESNNTNMFHLGTRMPTVVAPVDLERAIHGEDVQENWDHRFASSDKYTENQGQQQWTENVDIYTPHLAPQTAEPLYPKEAFPMNSFYPGAQNNDRAVGEAY